MVLSQISRKLRLQHASEDPEVSSISDTETLRASTAAVASPGTQQSPQWCFKRPKSLPEYVIPSRGLATLPTDIVFQIVENLDKVTAMSFVLTSKHFCQIFPSKDWVVQKHRLTQAERLTFL